MKVRIACMWRGSALFVEEIDYTDNLTLGDAIGAMLVKMQDLRNTVPLSEVRVVIYDFNTKE